MRLRPILRHVPFAPTRSLPRAGWAVAAVLAFAAAAPPAAHAQVIRTARDSQLNANYLIGAGPFFRSGSFRESESGLDARPALSLSGSDFIDGVLLGVPFTAQMSFSTSQEFQAQEVGGSLAELRGFGSTLASTSVTGLASAGVNVRAPGNELEIQFSVSAPTAFTLSGVAQDTNADNTSAAVRLDELMGTRFVPLFLFDDGAFFTSGVLGPGVYRVVGNASAQADAGETQSSSWDYTLRFAPLAPAAVPEPASAVLLGAGALGVLGYGWRRRRGANDE